MAQLNKKTPLSSRHQQLNAKIVDFGGWDMPIHYGSQIEEHHQVRRDVGMFDVSHMAVVDLKGSGIKQFLRYLLSNNVDKLKRSGKALYTCMLNDSGGIKDDLIVYYMHDEWFRMVVNAATREKDLAWINKQVRNFDVQVNERIDLAMIAVQGPQAREKVHVLLNGDVSSLQAMSRFCACMQGDLFIARTGYTGEDGYEVILADNNAEEFWDSLYKLGVKPIGLGARDTLRLEAGMNLYGTDMDETTFPDESALQWTVAWEPAERHFIGREALVARQNLFSKPRLVGLVLDGNGVLRNHQNVFDNNRIEIGEITSGSFSPTLKKSIAFARINNIADNSCKVEIRGKLLDVNIAKPPFVRDGKSCINQ